MLCLDAILRLLLMLLEMLQCLCNFATPVSYVDPNVTDFQLCSFVAW